MRLRSTRLMAASQGGGSWTPANLSPVLWLDSDFGAFVERSSPTTPCTAGSLCGTITARTGQVFTAPSADGNRMTWQTNGLQPQGSTSSLVTASTITITGDATFYSWGVSTNALQYTLGAAVTNRSSLGRSTAPNSCYFTRGSSAFSSLVVGTGTFSLIRRTRTGSTVRMAATGVPDALATNTGTITGNLVFEAINRENATHTTSTALRIKGELAFDRLLSASEEALLLAWLAVRGYVL